MKLGGHVSSAGGLSKAIERARDLGFETFQLFASAPQSFRESVHPESELLSFREELKRSSLGPVFLHAIYLINLASVSEKLYQLSGDSLAYYLSLCEKSGIEGVIFHLGSHKGLGFEKVKARVLRACEKVLTSTFTGNLIFENNAGKGDCLGSTFGEIGDLLRELRSDRVGLCLDSQHAFACGYDVAGSDGLNRMIEEIESRVGLEKLVVVHLNDSQVELGARSDRHENLGQGRIGLDGLRTFVTRKEFRNLPFILEVPGFEGKGPDRRNFEILKSLAGDRKK